MEAPWVSVCSRLSRISFERQPPRLVRWGFHASPFNPLLIGVTEDGVLCRIAFANGKKAAALLREWKKSWPQTEFAEDKKATAKILQQLAGKSRAGALKLQMTGTPFQQKVWKALLRVPAGKTVSYAALARNAGKPKAARAVGAAMGANPIPLIVPCHRVIASSGKLGGFGGGLPLKKKLLDAEKRAA